MMRRTMTISLVAGLVLATTAGTATAQDEDLRMGDDPAYFERVDVPEAGIAVSFPPDWAVDIEMDYAEMSPGDLETGYWNVLFASDDGGTWCDVTWYLAADGSLPELATLTADNFAAELGGDATAGTAPVGLSIGNAYRVDVQDPAQPSYTSIYMFDSEAGRYTLNCQADQRDAHDWMDIAETLEWLPGEEAIEPDQAIDGEPRVVFSVPTYELEPVEVPEAGVAMLLPVDWPLEVRMEELGYRLPPAYEDAGQPTVWDALRVESDIGDWCDLKIHVDNPMPLDEHALWDEQSYAAAASDDQIVERTTTVVADGVADMIDFRSAVGPEILRIYLFESDGTRFELTCYSPFDENFAWYKMADSVELLGAAPEPERDPVESMSPEADLQRLELEDVGVALSVPSEWTVIPQMEALSTALPPPYSELGEVTVWRMLESYDQADEWCNVYMYDEMPMSLDEHAAWFDAVVSANTELPATVEVAAVSLPIGESVRLVETYATGEVQVLYLFDLGGVREYLVCGASTLPADAWSSVAETIESLEPVAVDEDPPDLPDDAVAWSVVQQYGTQLPVADPTADAWLMSAWCDRAFWIEYADGTFEERLECRLTNDPVEPIEQQGRWPAETVTTSGSECEWTSEFWMVQDGSDVWASSWSVTVEPDGQVSGRSVYPVEELDCQSA